MRYTGRSFEYEEIDYRITGAVVTDQRIAVDWTEGNDRGNLVAESEDGIEYRGTYGYRTPESVARVEFHLYKDGRGEVILPAAGGELTVRVGGHG